MKEKLYHTDSIENDKLEELTQLQLKVDKQKKEDISSEKEVEHENKIIEKSMLQEDKIKIDLFTCMVQCFLHTQILPLCYYHRQNKHKFMQAIEKDKTILALPHAHLNCVYQ